MSQRLKRSWAEPQSFGRNSLVIVPAALPPDVRKGCAFTVNDWVMGYARYVSWQKFNRFLARECGRKRKAWDEGEAGIPGNQCVK